MLQLRQLESLKESLTAKTSLGCSTKRKSIKRKIKWDKIELLMHWVCELPHNSHPDMYSSETNWVIPYVHKTELKIRGLGYFRWSQVTRWTHLRLKMLSVENGSKAERIA